MKFMYIYIYNSKNIGIHASHSQIFGFSFSDYVILQSVLRHSISVNQKIDWSQSQQSTLREDFNNLKKSKYLSFLMK